MFLTLYLLISQSTLILSKQHKIGSVENKFAVLSMGQRGKTNSKIKSS